MFPSKLRAFLRDAPVILYGSLILTDSPDKAGSIICGVAAIVLHAGTPTM